MRELKFRVWDKLQNQMIVVKQLNWYKNMDRLLVNGCWVDPDRPLMQYTGLKDKNGKEIYEGDVLATDWMVKKKEPGYLVKWEEYGFSPFDFVLDKRDNFTVFGALYNFQIIGNIYENKELLDGTRT